MVPTGDGLSWCAAVLSAVVVVGCKSQDARPKPEARASATASAEPSTAPSSSAPPTASGSAAPSNPTTLDAGVDQPNITAEHLTTEGLKLTNIACRADDPGAMGVVALVAPVGKVELYRKCLPGFDEVRMWWSFRKGKITEVTVTKVDAGAVCMVQQLVGTKALAFDGNGACVATVALRNE